MTDSNIIALIVAILVLIGTLCAPIVARRSLQEESQEIGHIKERMHHAQSPVEARYWEALRDYKTASQIVRRTPVPRAAFIVGAVGWVVLIVLLAVQISPSQLQSGWVLAGAYVVPLAALTLYMVVAWSLYVRPRSQLQALRSDVAQRRDEYLGRPQTSPGPGSTTAE